MTTMNQRTIRRLAAGLSAVALTVSCGDSDSVNRMRIRNDRAPVEAGAAQQVVVKKVDPGNSGTITGTVRWDGAIPAPQRIDVSGNPDCVKVSKDPIFEEKLVVNPNSTVKFCLVSIDTNDVYAAPDDAVVIDQVSCHYVPHVFGVMANQKLKIRSSDPTLHNVHYLSPNDPSVEENFAMNPGGPDKVRSFSSADMIKFKCEVHPWMGAWCAVKSHPFFAVTGEDGSYTIKNVPPGKQKLVMHHEKLGDQTVEVTVEAGKTITQDFKLKQ